MNKKTLITLLTILLLFGLAANYSITQERNVHWSTDGINIDATMQYHYGDTLTTSVIIQGEGTDIDIPFMRIFNPVVLTLYFTDKNDNVIENISLRYNDFNCSKDSCKVKKIIDFKLKDYLKVKYLKASGGEQ